MSDWTQLKFNMDVPVNVTIQAWGDGNLTRLDNYDKPQYYVGDKCKFTASAGLHDLLMAKGVKNGQTVKIEKKSSTKTDFGVFHVDDVNMDTLGSNGQQQQAVNNPIAEQPPVQQVAPVTPQAPTQNIGNNGEDKTELVSRLNNVIELLSSIKKDMELPF